MRVASRADAVPKRERAVVGCRFTHDSLERKEGDGRCAASISASGSERVTPPQ
jgi:hypothetical protein